jgi:hypothetical protein
MELGTIDGEPVLLVLFQRGDQWQVAWPVRVHVAGRFIDRIEDYYACPWIIENASEGAAGLTSTITWNRIEIRPSTPNASLKTDP